MKFTQVAFCVCALLCAALTVCGPNDQLQQGQSGRAAERLLDSVNRTGQGRCLGCDEG